MATCKGSLKHGLFTLNIIFMIYHVVFNAFGLYINYKINSIKGTLVEQINMFIIISVITCVTILVLALLGYYGTIREKVGCTITYSILMLIMFLGQVYCIVQASRFYHLLILFGDRFVSRIWENHGTEQKAMDRLQTSFKCCGKNGYDDYNPLNESTPNSCCGEDATYCSAVYANWNGCQGAVLSAWHTILLVVIYGTIGIAIVEFVTFIVSCCLANQFLKKKKEVISRL